MARIGMSSTVLTVHRTSIAVFRIHGIRKFLGLTEPDPDSFIIQQNLDCYSFVISLHLFMFEE